MYRNPNRRAFILFCMLAAYQAPLAAAQAPPGETLLSSYGEMLGSGTDQYGDALRLARSLADRVQAEDYGTWFFIDPKDGPAGYDPAFAVILARPATGEALGALSAFLSRMDTVSRAGVADTYAFLLPEPGWLDGGDALPDGINQVLDQDATTVLILAYAPTGTKAMIHAEGAHILSPRSLLEGARAALGAAKLDYREDPVGGLLDRVGLSKGYGPLGPWLASGYAAIGIESPSDSADVLLGLGAAVPGRERPDRNYLRYPLPSGVLTLSDDTIVLLSCLCGGALALYWALHARRKEGLIEALAAFGTVLLSLFAMQALSLGARSLATLAFRAPAGLGLPAVSLSARAGGVAFAYFALSGFASRLGLSRSSARVSALHAGMLLLTLGGLVSAAYAPVLLPFFCLFAALMMLSARSAVAAGLCLALALALLLPFSLGLFAERDAEAIRALLRPSPAFAALMALFVSPLALWLGAALSPEARLRRGKGPAAAFAACALACAAAEAVAAALMSGR